jgi:hypothetical protein
MVITNVSQKTVDTLKAQLTSKNGATVTDSTISGHGVNASYSYDAKSQQLTVNVTHHPFYVPESHIESELRGAVAKLQQQQTPASAKSA